MNHRIRHKKTARLASPADASGFSGIEVIVLAGGLGTRLQRVVSDRQKVMAPVRGMPFLEILLRRLFAENVGRIILCVGYMKDGVMRFVREAAMRDPRFLRVEFSEEDEPLGTGGAVKRASITIRGDDCVVMNGDTLSDVGIGELYRFHKDRGYAVSIAVMERGKSDGGRINLDNSGRIVDFREKSGTGKFMNAGVYAMNKKVFSHMPEGPFSLEKDFFPEAVAALPCGAFITKRFVDIGTPEQYKLANEVFEL